MMDQAQLKAIYEASNPSDKTKANFNELSKKLALIVGGAKLSEIQCLKNEKTGELYYTRCK